MGLAAAEHRMALYGAALGRCLQEHHGQPMTMPWRMTNGLAISHAIVPSHRPPSWPRWRQ